MTSLFRSVFWAIVILVLVCAALGWVVWGQYQTFLSTPLALEQPEIILEVPTGTTMRKLAERLRAERIFANPYFFIALAYQKGQMESLKAGEYAVRSGMLPGELLERLTSGRSIEFPVTLVEGRTFREALATIAAQPAFVSELTGLDDEEIIRRVGIEAGHPEGWIFPDTYRFRRGTTDTQVLRRAYKRMRDILASEWEGRDAGLPLQTPYEALILASIVEKETAVAAERPRIAGVFVRRLEKGMRLQTDPTVIYGLGDAYDGNIRKEDLSRPTPYNTYAVAGLPPTPIALPGREAIHAALHPADGDSLYFVARGDGTHYFSSNLDEHNCAVRHYQLKQPCSGLRE